MEQPKRKTIRLRDYDYSNAGVYFITVCVKDRKALLWNNVGASIARPQDVNLSAYGKIVDDAIRQIPIHYPDVNVDNYVVMPNHIHLLLSIEGDINGHNARPYDIEYYTTDEGICIKTNRSQHLAKIFHRPHNTQRA